MSFIRFGVLALTLLTSSLRVAAQVPPSPAEAAAYIGLHAAAHRGDEAMLKRLISQTPSALEQRDPVGRTALHVATFARQSKTVGVLLEAGANSGALENGHYDAVTIAAVANDEETLRVLLARGASAKLVTSRYDGTALIAAAHLGHDGVVRQLIAAGAPLNHVNNLHWTALIESIVLGNGGAAHQRTLQALLDAGADTQLTDREGRTPLQLAQARGYEGMVRALIAARAR